MLSVGNNFLRTLACKILNITKFSPKNFNLGYIQARRLMQQPGTSCTISTSSAVLGPTQDATIWFKTFHCVTVACDGFKHLDSQHFKPQCCWQLEGGVITLLFSFLSQTVNTIFNHSIIHITLRVRKNFHRGSTTPNLGLVCASLEHDKCTGTKAISMLRQHSTF